MPKLPATGFLAVDVETTGLGPKSRVVEVAWVHVSHRGSIGDSFSTLLYADGSSGTWPAKRVHGIRDDDLLDAPRFAEIESGFTRSLQGKILVAHNAKFDVACINSELRRLRKPQLKSYACTLEIGIRLGNGRLSLSKAVKQFRLRHDRPHQALDDALATAQLLKRYLAMDRQRVRTYMEEKYPQLSAKKSH
jgi:DNA polymerase-3 subunit epsilon